MMLVYKRSSAAKHFDRNLLLTQSDKSGKLNFAAEKAAEKNS